MGVLWYTVWTLQVISFTSDVFCCQVKTAVWFKENEHRIFFFKEITLMEHYSFVKFWYKMEESGKETNNFLKVTLSNETSNRPLQTSEKHSESQKDDHQCNCLSVSLTDEIRQTMPWCTCFSDYRYKNGRIYRIMFHNFYSKYGPANVSAKFVPYSSMNKMRIN
jgi:hypothetical protein